eukprot:SAG31_NODE_4560_length_3137_cov_7.770244_2_plen_127_part_00
MNYAKQELDGLARAAEDPLFDTPLTFCIVCATMIARDSLRVEFQRITTALTNVLSLGICGTRHTWSTLVWKERLKSLNEQASDNDTQDDEHGKCEARQDEIQKEMMKTPSGRTRQVGRSPIKRHYT